MLPKLHPSWIWEGASNGMVPLRPRLSPMTHDCELNMPYSRGITVVCGRSNGQVKSYDYLQNQGIGTLRRTSNPPVSGSIEAECASVQPRCNNQKRVIPLVGRSSVNESSHCDVSSKSDGLSSDWFHKFPNPIGQRSSRTAGNTVRSTYM